MIKRLLCILIPCLLFVISCAKDSSEDESSVYVSPPFNNSNTESPSTSVTQFTLTVSAGEGGSVSTTGGTYNDGASINIVATASEGYKFIGWTGSESTNSNITLTISSNITISANFEIDCRVSALETLSIQYLMEKEKFDKSEAEYVIVLKLTKTLLRWVVQLCAVGAITVRQP